MTMNEVFRLRDNSQLLLNFIIKEKWEGIILPKNRVLIYTLRAILGCIKQKMYGTAKQYYFVLRKLCKDDTEINNFIRDNKLFKDNLREIN